VLQGDNKVVLEEFDFAVREDGAGLRSWIAAQAVSDGATRERLKTHLVILHDDDFTHFARHATEVTARIALDASKKTVKEGALFYEELLPAETIFYSLVFAEPSRKPDHSADGRAVLEYLRASLPRVLQVGGDETTGKGLCSWQLLNGREARS
jgi:CRISPR-associated protein Cmr4